MISLFVAVVELNLVAVIELNLVDSLSDCMVLRPQFAADVAGWYPVYVGGGAVIGAVVIVRREINQVVLAVAVVVVAVVGQYNTHSVDAGGLGLLCTLVSGFHIMDVTALIGVVRVGLAIGAEPFNSGLCSVDFLGFDVIPSLLRLAFPVGMGVATVDHARISSPPRIVTFGGSHVIRSDLVTAVVAFVTIVVLLLVASVRAAVAAFALGAIRAWGTVVVIGRHVGLPLVDLGASLIRGLHSFTRKQKVDRLGGSSLVGLQFFE